MFDSLSSKLGAVFDRLRGRGALNENDVFEAMREVRLALLEADVALPVVKDFIANVRARAVGHEVLKSVTPGQQVVKIVNDCLIEALGGAGAVPLNLNAPAPIPILMVGLQGSGKTTSSGKIALRLATREKKKVLLASLDIQRPGAQLQLQLLAEKAGVGSLPIVPGQTPLEIARRAMDTARREVYDVVLLDTAGRLSIDQALMDEVKAIRDATHPVETLLVVDAMTGQDAVNTARAFNEAVGVTGIVMTRMDGDARGGAALSMRQITGAPIKLTGSGEKLDALEDFHPERVAGRGGDHRPRRSRQDGQADDEGAVHPGRLRRPVEADFQDGQYFRHPRHAARDGQDEGTARGGQPRQQNIQTPAGDHWLDDGAGAAATGHLEGQPQETYRRGFGRDRRRREPAAETVRRRGDDDETGRQDGCGGCDARDGRYGAAAPIRAAAQALGKGGSLLFVNKKKQKNFVTLAGARPRCYVRAPKE